MAARADGTKPRALSNEVRATIVVGWALYKRPAEIQKEVIETFGVELSFSQIAFYNPEGARAHELAQRWKNLFATARDAFEKEVRGIPIASKAFRLSVLDEELQRELEKARGGKHYRRDAILDVLERAAKEMGGAYTNTRVLEAGDATLALAKLLGCHPSELPGPGAQP